MFFCRIAIISIFVLFTMHSQSSASPVIHTDCNIDYDKDGFDKFKSYIDDKGEGVEIVKPEIIEYANHDKQKDVQMDHYVNLPDGTGIRHNILCDGDYLMSLISFFDIKGYSAEGDLKQVVDNIEKVIKKMPVKKDAVLFDKLEEIKKYVLYHVPLSEVPKVYEKDSKTGEYIKLPAACYNGDSKTREDEDCPKLDENFGVIYIMPAFFNIHLNLKP